MSPTSTFGLAPPLMLDSSDQQFQDSYTRWAYLKDTYKNKPYHRAKFGPLSVYRRINSRLSQLPKGYTRFHFPTRTVHWKSKESYHPQLNDSSHNLDDFSIKEKLIFNARSFHKNNTGQDVTFGSPIIIPEIEENYLSTETTLLHAFYGAPRRGGKMHWTDYMNVDIASTNSYWQNVIATRDKSYLYWQYMGAMEPRPTTKVESNPSSVPLSNNDGTSKKKKSTTLKKKFQPTTIQVSETNFRTNPKIKANALIGKDELLKLDRRLSHNTSHAGAKTGKGVRKVLNLQNEIRKTFFGDERKRNDTKEIVCHLDDIQIETLYLSRHHSLAELKFLLNKYVANSLSAQLHSLAGLKRTTMNNPIQMLSINDNYNHTQSDKKKVVTVIAGIQGSDHYAVSAAMYFIQELQKNADEYKDLLTLYKFHVVPVLNPDGYQYSYRLPEHRLWPKNLDQSMEDSESCRTREINCIIKPCYGVHLEHNMVYNTATKAEYLNACDRGYAGKKYTSEIKALKTLLTTLRTDIFIALKEGANIGVTYTELERSDEINKQFKKQAFNAARAASAVGGRDYLSGPLSEFSGIFEQGIETWVKQQFNVQYSFALYVNKHNETNVYVKVVNMETMNAITSLLQPEGEVSLQKRSYTNFAIKLRTMYQVILSLVLISNYVFFK